jgi:hypothetical protein
MEMLQAGGLDGDDTSSSSSSTSCSGTVCAGSDGDVVQDLRLKVASLPLDIEHHCWGRAVWRTQSMSPTLVVDVSLAVGSELTIRMCTWTCATTTRPTLRICGMWRATILNECAAVLAKHLVFRAKSSRFALDRFAACVYGWCCYGFRNSCALNSFLRI